MIPNNPEIFEMKLEKRMIEKPLIQITNIIVASLYIISGVSQPLLMTIVNNAGLGDSKYQIYILFYYFGLALKKIF